MKAKPVFAKWLVASNQRFSLLRVRAKSSPKQSEHFQGGLFIFVRPASFKKCYEQKVQLLSAEQQGAKKIKKINKAMTAPSAQK